MDEDDDKWEQYAKDIDVNQKTSAGKYLFFQNFLIFNKCIYITIISRIFVNINITNKKFLKCSSNFRTLMMNYMLRSVRYVIEE